MAGSGNRLGRLAIPTRPPPPPPAGFRIQPRLELSLGTAAVLGLLERTGRGVGAAPAIACTLGRGQPWEVGESAAGGRSRGDIQHGLSVWTVKRKRKRGGPDWAGLD
ncbi:hypothetical protein LX36DRAFT_54706 [Colletotrichum falcatum]|nr:hypothetical protein LX36DRAFT_54706 [Colletotrichum falcatum]